MTSRSGQSHLSILALGNLMRTDDAVGMLTARALQESGRLPGTVEVIEGGTLGLDLLVTLDETSHLLVLDAVDFGAPPGTLKSSSNEEIGRLPTSRSVHLLGLSDLINAMLLMDAPAMEMVLLGVDGLGNRTDTKDGSRAELFARSSVGTDQQVGSANLGRGRPSPLVIL